MAKKSSKSIALETDAASAPAEAPVNTVARRQTSVPRTSKSKTAPAPVATAVATNSEKVKDAPAAASPEKVSADMIARRAYELWQSGAPGSEMDHWLEAERQLGGR